MAGSGAMEGKISPLLIIFFHFVYMSMPHVLRIKQNKIMDKELESYKNP